MVVGIEKNELSADPLLHSSVLDQNRNSAEQ